MAYQTIFERYEYKYLITRAQKESILKAMEPYMQPDEYGPTTIRNIYYDTEDYRLIRRSLERPVYKEKLRLRSYAQASPESTVFAELKKKYKSVVYKRRLALPEAAAGLCWPVRSAVFPIRRFTVRSIIFYRIIKPCARCCI